VLKIRVPYLLSLQKVGFKLSSAVYEGTFTKNKICKNPSIIR
jgi:hypothetical protein